MAHPHPEHPSGYEKQDASVRNVTIIAVVGVLLLIVSAVLLDDYFVHTREQQVYELSLQPVSADLKQLRSTEEKLLNSYALIDSTTGRYRIPVYRAMELVAAESTEGDK